MTPRRRTVASILVAAGLTIVALPVFHAADKLDPLVCTIRFPDPASKSFTVEIAVPTEKRASVDLMMAIWSPGFYGLQNYADRVSNFAAKAPDGTALDVTKPTPARWTVATGGRPSFTVTYTVAAPRGSNLGNGTTETSAVIIGPATYITLVETAHRRAEVRLELPSTWKGSMTSLDAAPGGKPNDYVAPDYDTLADSPILAGVDLVTTPFSVGGIQHYWTYLGQAEWDGTKIAAVLTPLIEEHIRFWGELPYKKYAFLNIIVNGGGSGVEHLNSVAITTSGKEPMTQEAKFRNAAFISHEYFHAMNVKRLRPVELGPFDYEHSPVTTGLWVAEGLTSYFGDLLSERSGLGSPEDYLNFESKHITDLQTKQAGRLFQTLEQSSSQMFDRSIPADKKVDYYVKGPVVGLVLDAHIRHLTNGNKSMDDVMRLEYKRWSGAHGYTAEQFSQTMSDAAGVDMSALLHKLVATTDEVDYTEMLDWFGWRFAKDDDPAKAWTLEVRPDATPEQRAHFAAFMAHSKAK
jgi:predicted metalloprotease with PDZ domain